MTPEIKRALPIARQRPDVLELTNYSWPLFLMPGRDRTLQGTPARLIGPLSHGITDRRG
jgi:hypothetical protein